MQGLCGCCPTCVVFILTFDDLWAGQGHCGICFKCSTFFKAFESEDDEKKALSAFKSSAKKSWSKATTDYRAKAQRARSATYKTIAARLKVAFPGATHEVLREVTIMRTQAMASAFEAGLKLETPVMIETRASFHMQYLDRLDELAADPTIVRPAQAIKLRAEEHSG